MAEIINRTDLPAAVQAAELVDDMVAGANARASRVAPCLVAAVNAGTQATEAQTDLLAEAKLVLLGAVKRWAEAGSGAWQSRTQSAGPYALAETVDTRQRTGFNLWPSEITQLQEICKTTSAQGKAYAIDTVGAASAHLPWCDLAFGSGSCSCGADIAGEPIYELG